jgi:acyl-CoA hydrolase
VVLDLTDYLRPGDHVAWPQGSGEPLTLVRRLIEQRGALGGIHVFFGTLISDSLLPGNVDGLHLTSFGGLMKAARLTRRGLVDIIPIRVSQVPRLIESGEIPVDVALVHLAGPDDQGRFSVGLIGDYVHEMIARARVVIAEVNDQAPFTLGSALVEPSSIDVFVPVGYPPAEVERRVPAPGSDVAVVAQHIAGLIPDGATIQLGIGGVIDALPDYLAGKNDLGLHTGVMGDAALALIESEVVTNRRKEIDIGTSVTGGFFGTSRLYRWADRNRAVAVRGLDYTHSPAVLGNFASFWSVNSALEVDLTGQVNSEMISGRYSGGIGGQLDFINAATVSRRGRSIVGLTSTAAGGTVSRISSRLADSVVSAPRADADLVVTEFGVADLRAKSLTQRAERLIEIAHPDFRNQLRAEWRRG